MSTLRHLLPFLSAIATPAIRGHFTASVPDWKMRDLRYNDRERHAGDTRSPEQRRADRKANRKRRMALRLKRGRGRS